MVTIRELLFCPAAWVAWLESDTVLERQIDRRSGCLQASTSGDWLAERAADQFAMLVEHKDIRREWVRWIELARTEAGLLIASAGQTVAGFENVDLEMVAAIGVEVVVKSILAGMFGLPERDTRGEIQSTFEQSDLVALGRHDVLAVARVIQRGIVRTNRIDDGSGRRD
jgi:hypothetical protein